MQDDGTEGTEWACFFLYIDHIMMTWCDCVDGIGLLICCCYCGGGVK